MTRALTLYWRKLVRPMDTETLRSAIDELRRAQASTEWADAREVIPRMIAAHRAELRRRERKRRRK